VSVLRRRRKPYNPRNPPLPPAFAVAGSPSGLSASQALGARYFFAWIRRYFPDWELAHGGRGLGCLELRRMWMAAGGACVCVRGPKDPEEEIPEEEIAWTKSRRVPGRNQSMRLGMLGAVFAAPGPADPPFALARRLAHAAAYCRSGTQERRGRPPHLAVLAPPSFPADLDLQAGKGGRPQAPLFWATSWDPEGWRRAPRGDPGLTWRPWPPSKRIARRVSRPVPEKKERRDGRA